MSKRFTDNELRAYSKNRFEERSLRRRLNKLRDEVVIYHDNSAKKRINLIEESKSIRKTSGGSPTPNAILDLDDDFEVGQRLRRPWAYSVMETTHNNMYREAEVPLPKKRGRSRAKSAATSLLGNTSTMTFPLDRCKTETQSVLPRVVQSANYDGKLPRVIEPNRAWQEVSNNAHVTQQKNKNMSSTSRYDGSISEYVSSESSQNVSNMQVDIIHIPSPNDDIKEEEEVFQRSSTWLSEKDLDRRPYARVLKLPPAYTIDSKSYQDAERERLAKRSKSRVGFSSASIVANMKEQLPPPKNKTPDKTPDTKPDATVVKDIPPQEQDRKDDEQSGSSDDKSKNVLTVKDCVTFKGLVIKNYIRPEDRYKLDPSVLNRHQNRMDKLAKESTTYLKRINHENIKVEIAFPRSARKRLLTKLVRDNNSGKKKTVANNDAPVIQTKVERFMMSMGSYIEKQEMDRAATFIY